MMTDEQMREEIVQSIRGVAPVVAALHAEELADIAMAVFRKSRVSSDLPQTVPPVPYSDDTIGVPYLRADGTTGYTPR